jgi:hypothetical protein
LFTQLISHVSPPSSEKLYSNGESSVEFAFW